MKTLKMKPVVEGYVKYRDGKKWKRRYCVLCLSPCTQYVLHLYLGKSYDDFASHRSSGNVNCVQRPTQGSDEIAAASNCTTSAVKTGFPLGAGVFGCRSAAAAGGVAPSGVSSASSSGGGSGASSSTGGGGGGYTANPVTELCNKMEEACQNDFAQAVHVARGLNAPTPYDVITGFESGCHQDRESHVLLLVGRATVHAIAHQTMDDMFTWAETLERHVKDSSYHVTLCRVGGDSGCKLGVGLQASLHVQQWRVCLVGEPSAGCKFICQWRLDAIDTMYTMEPPPGTAAALAGGSGTTGCTSGLASGLAIGPSSVASGGAADGLSGSGAGSGGAGGGSGLSASTSGSTVLDCRGSVEDLLVLKTNKNAGKVQGNFTFQVDSHRLPQLTKAIEELMLRRFPTLTSPVATTKSPLPADDNFPATGILPSGLTHSASTTSYGMEISFPAPHRAAAAAATSSLSSSLSQGASAENSSPPVMLMMGRSHPNQACSPLSSSFPREGNLMRSEANRYVNISSSNRSYTGIPAQGDGGQPREKRHQFSIFTKAQGMERSDEIVIPQSRLCGLEASAGAIPDENPTGKDHRQLYHHRPQQQQQWQNGKSLNVPVGSTGSDTGSTRSENSASSCSLARQPQQLHQQQPPPPSATQSNHVFPSVKVFAGVITSLTPAPSTVASSASLASHISDAPARVQSGSGGARGTPPYRGTSGSLRTKTTTPFNSPPRPLLATADPYSGSVNSYQQSSQTSPSLRKISTVSMPKMLMTTVVPPTTAATNAPAPTMAPGTTAYYCERCHLHGALSSAAAAAAAKAVSARHQQHYRGQRHFQHKCKKAAHRRPRSADPSLLVTASESSPAPPQSPRGQEQLPSGPSHFHQDVFTVDEDVSAVLSGKGPPPAAKNPSASSDTASLSLSHRIGQIFQSLYSGLAGGGAGRGGSSSTRPPLDGSTSVGDESPCLRNSASSTCREGAKPPRPLLPSESKWGVCPRVSALHNSPSQDPSRLHCCDDPPLSYCLRPHAFAPVNRCQPLRRSRTFDECDLRRRRVRRQHLLDFLVCDSESNQTAEEEEQDPPPLPVTSLVPASSDCLFLLVPNLPSTEKSGDDAGGGRWRSRRFLLHQYGSCCSCNCSWQRTPPGVTAPPPPAPSPTHIVDRSERLGCLSSPSTHSNWGSGSHLALADSSPCLRTSKFRVWRVLPDHRSRNAASLTTDSAATAKSGFMTGPPLRAEALSNERSLLDKVPYPSLTRNRPQTSSSTWSVLSLSLSEWAESAPLRFEASVMSTNAGGGGGAGSARFFSPQHHHRRRLSHSCLFDSTTPIDHPSLSPCCCCSPVSASSLSLSSREGDAYLSGPSSKCLPSVSASETARGRTSFCDLCGSSVVTGAAPLAQHRKRAMSHSERDDARRQLHATSKPYRSTLTKTSSSGNGGGGGGGGNSGILHEYANFAVCGRANTLPYNKHGQRGSDRQTHGRRANAEFKSHDLPFAVPAVSDRHQQPSGDVCDGFSAFARAEGANLKSQEVRTTVSASQQFPSVNSLSSSTASHTSSPGSPPIPYCNLPNPLLATSSSSGGGGGGSMSSSNSYFYQQQQAAAERAALSDAVASYANWPMLCGRRGQVSSGTTGRYGTLSGSPPSLAAPLLPMNSLREPSDAALRPTGEPLSLRRSYCGPPTPAGNITGVSEAGKSTCVMPDEVRDPKRNYALVDLRPSPASSVLTPTDITINPSCAGSRASNFSAAGPSAIADVHPSRNTCEDLVSEPDSSASTLMGFSTTSSSTLLQQRTQQHSATNDAGDAGATGSMDSKQSQLSAGFSARSGTYRRRHSHSLSSALPEPPLNYVHVITMPRRSAAGGGQGQDAPQRQFPRQERISVDSLPPRCTPRESWGEESSSGSGAETLLSDPTPAAPSLAADVADAPRTSDVAYAQIDFVRTRALSAVNGNLESLLSSVSEREAAAMAASLGVAGGSGTATKAGRSAFGLKSVSRSKRIINRGSRKKSNICPGDP